MNSILALLLTLLLLPVVLYGQESDIKIGSKNFTEQIILGEMLAQVLEANTELTVSRVFNLAGTKFTFEALIAGDIDIYPEYTGTGLVNILNYRSSEDRLVVYETVQREFRDQFNVTWLSPLGFNNTYALAVRDQDEHLSGLTSISDLSRVSNELDFAAPHEFLDRPDGYPQLQKVYGLEFNGIRGLDPGLMYTAIEQQQVDVISAFSTDGRIAAFNLRLLKDDKSIFPPYEAAPIVRNDTMERHPELFLILEQLAGKISNQRMTFMNHQVDSLGYSPAAVAQEFLLDMGLLETDITRFITGRQDNFLIFLWDRRLELFYLTIEHLWLVGIAMLIAILIGVPAGIVLTRIPSLRSPVFTVVNVFQTIPSLALLGFLIPLLGIGATPAIVALFVYALLPLVRNTHTGILEVDSSLREAALGLGLTDMQILRKVELPLALPLIMAGVRTSTVIAVGTATLAALIGAGGLGDPIFRGISSVNSQLILFGAVPAAILALTLDRILHLLERFLAFKQVQNPG